MASFNASVSEESRSSAPEEITRTRTRTRTGQCPPRQTPTLGNLKIEEGNGTSVGTVITLECPSSHVAVSGGQVSCIQDRNITHWSGTLPECKPLPLYENGAFHLRNVGYGFHLAVLLSIISLAIIIFMSMIFITSCLLKRVKKEESRRMERRRRKKDEAYWQNMDQQEMREAFYSHKGGNTNNNNSTSQQHAHHPVHQAALNVQDLTFKDLQTASRRHQQDYNLSVHPSRPPHEAMPPNAYMKTQPTFVLQPQLLPPEQPPWIRPIPTPVVPQDKSGVSGQGFQDSFWQNQHSPDPKSPPIWVISV